MYIISNYIHYINNTLTHSSVTAATQYIIINRNLVLYFSDENC
jgi:hypothetical protein